jgi:hypothetical protein
MRFFYALLICLVMNISLQAEENSDQKTRFLKNNAYKIATSLLATIYKHPFMTCWSLYSIFGPKAVEKPDRFINWFIDALLLGDFAHNLLHAYKISHHPCDSKVNTYCVNLEIREIKNEQGSEEVSKPIVP